jgi:hypothetical protein
VQWQWQWQWQQQRQEEEKILHRVEGHVDAATPLLW